MPGPNSAPNGDTTIVRGHMNEEFLCDIHASKHLDACRVNEERREVNPKLPPCHIVSKREYLLKRNRLRTGKTA